jgi:hypothetical protein
MVHRQGLNVTLSSSSPSEEPERELLGAQRSLIPLYTARCSLSWGVDMERNQRMGVWELSQGIAVAFQNPPWLVQRAIRRAWCDQQPLGELPGRLWYRLVVGRMLF